MSLCHITVKEAQLGREKGLPWVTQPDRGTASIVPARSRSSKGAPFNTVANSQGTVRMKRRSSKRCAASHTSGLAATLDSSDYRMYLSGGTAVGRSFSATLQPGCWG